MVCCLFQHFTEVTPGSVVEVRDNSIAWCYGVADPELASWQAREMQASTLASALGDLPLDIVADTRVVEVRVAVRARGVSTVVVVAACISHAPRAGGRGVGWGWWFVAQGASVVRAVKLALRCLASEVRTRCSSAHPCTRTFVHV